MNETKEEKRVHFFDHLLETHPLTKDFPVEFAPLKQVGEKNI